MVLENAGFSVHVCTCACVHACVQVLMLDTMKLPRNDLNCLKIIFRFIFEQYLTFKVKPFKCQVSAVAGPLYN